MTATILQAAEQIARLRDTLRIRVSFGPAFTSEDLQNLIKELRTIEEMARENEIELAIHQGLKRPVPVAIENRDNVIALPIKRRASPHIVPDGGGDAA